MPGIAGIIAPRFPADNTEAVDAMVRSMMHEEFYSSGSFNKPELGLSVGWVSHKGSFSDCMPVCNETKDIYLFMGGEEFADQSDFSHLRRRGHEFCAENASYLVHLYEELGMGFLERLNGWFSGLLVDLREEKVVLFNDRYGLGRIYIYETPEALFFASEAKALLSVLPDLRQLDLQSLAEFFSCGCALQNRSLFSGVSLLPGGARWTFLRSQPPKKERYFRPEMWENHSLSPTGSQYYEVLRETFARVLPKYLRGARPMGMSLTGGLDGRIVMAWAGRAPGTLPCYTFGGPYRDCADVKIARKVARTCGQSHQVIRVGEDYLKRFRTYLEKAIYVSDGAADVAGSTEFYINRAAREIAPVRLTGILGSEILRGHVAFKPQPLNDALCAPEFTRLIRLAATTYAEERRGTKLSFIAFKQVPWHHCSRIAVEQSQITLRSPYLDNELVALMYQLPENLRTDPQLSLRLIADGSPALSRIPSDRGVLYRPIPLLTMARQMCHELTFRAEYAYDYGMPQWLARVDQKLAPLHIERLFLGRHKFEHFRVWYRRELAEFVKDVLLDARTRQRPYVRGRLLEHMVNDHLAGHHNFTREIHKILSAELIQRQFTDRRWNPPERSEPANLVTHGASR